MDYNKQHINGLRIECMLKKRSGLPFLRFFCMIAMMQSMYAEFKFDDFDFDDFSIESPMFSSPEEDQISFDTDLGNANCEPQFSPLDVVTILTSPEPILFPSPIEIQNILQLDLYRYTNPIVIRSLHELPSMYPLLYGSPRWGVSAEGFYNQTTKTFLTKHSPCLLSYIELISSDDFLNIIDQKDFSSLNIPDVLSIFGNITLEERRFGVILSGWRNWKHWIFSVALPVYYIEHNFFLSQEKQEQLTETAPLFGSGGGDLPGIILNPLDNFLSQHFARDKAGIGDLRLQIFYEFVRRKNQQVQLGLQVTFPTAKVEKVAFLQENSLRSNRHRLLIFRQSLI